MKPKISEPKKYCFLIMTGFLLGMALLWLAGCACSDGRPRNLEADFGRSVTNNRLEMMVTPPDAVDPKPALGLTPQAAQNSQSKYDKSFEAKKQERTIIPLITTGSAE